MNTKQSVAQLARTAPQAPFINDGGGAVTLCGCWRGDD